MGAVIAKIIVVAWLRSLLEDGVIIVEDHRGVYAQVGSGQIVAV